jgi:uncharacterized protein (TIGR03437 family)
LVFGLNLAGTSVQATGSYGVAWKALLHYVSPAQGNFLIPDGAACGAAMIRVTSGDEKVSTGGLRIARLAPGSFEANSAGLAAATLVRTQPA